MSNKNKGLIFISNVTKAMEHEWFLEFALQDKLDLEFVLFNSKDSELYQCIVKHKVNCKNYHLPSKFYIPFYILFFSVKLIFQRFKFVHCHLFEASIIGLTAAKVAGIKKRIHTRHHADFHHVYFPNAVKYDLYVNKLSTHIIAVSSNIKTILMEREQVPENKIIVIPHGIPSKIMDQTVSVKEIESIKEKYQLTAHHPIIGVISRFTEWKGVQYVIPAFKKLLNDFPNAKLVLANANGDYENNLKLLLSELPVNSYLLIKFEAEINALFKNFDVFVHVPIDKFCEAFGQVYIEALCLEVPMVCTLSGVACDLIKDEENAMVVDYKNANAIYTGVKKILEDHALKDKLIMLGKADVREYTFEKKFAKLKTIYL
jgi:glycosyltransferase involved in cell wall biosynthesis